MAKRLVDIFDAYGSKLFTYFIALEGEDSLEAEFEEVALIFAENSGLAAQTEIAHLRARCAVSSIASEAAAERAHANRKGAVISLVKHRMKLAQASATAGERARLRNGTLA